MDPRVVIRSASPQRARALQGLLAEGGLEAMALAGLGAQRPAPDGEDVRVIAADEGDLAGLPPLAAARGAALAWLHPWDAPPAAPSAAPTADALCLQTPPPLLARQILALHREAGLAWEVSLRAETAAGLGLALPPPAAAAAALQALYVGPPSAAFLAFEHACAGLGVALTAAFTSYAAFDALHDAVFDGVIVDGRADPGGMLSLCGALRRNAALHATPAALLAPDGDAACLEEAIERGVDLIWREREGAGLAAAWCAELMRRARRRRSHEATLADLAKRAAGPKRGLMSQVFFEAHLERLGEAFAAAGRPLAAALVRACAAPGARPVGPAAWDRALADAGAIAVSLLRTQDSVCAVAPDALAVLMPGCSEAEARSALARVIAVAETTAFAAENGPGPLVFDASVCLRLPGESGLGLLARLSVPAPWKAPA